MDTDKLNHELQIFRNHVKIARENIIHKLVRDIKFWKAKHESNADNGRASKKMKSLEAVMGHIKAQPASELTKAVIRFNPKKSVGGGLEERALMRFHENKKLLPEMKALIRRFGLSSKMEVLDKYLKSRGDGKKGKGGKKGKKDKKRKKVQKEKKVVEQESEDQGFCEAGADDDESMGSGSESDSAEDEDEEEVGKFVKLTPVKEKVVKKEPKVAEKKPKKVEKKQKEKKEFKPPEEEDSENKCVQIQDSFFVTSSGQSYVATAPVIDKKQQQQEEEEEFSWKRANKRKDILGNKEERPQKRPFSKDADEDNDVHPSWKAKQQQKGINQFQGQRKRLDEEDENPDLHPSWAAKQKQRSLQPFAGKKIKFESTETENPASGEDLHPSWAAKQKQKGLKPFQGKKIVFDSGEQVEEYKRPQQQPAEDVHPSWAAKQKQKGLKPFQGKKIVFDSGAQMEEQQRQPAEDVHPSWAAKQKQKGLKPFQGKKIVFEANEDRREAVTKVEAPTDLHPSWAAKQKEKGIQEFRGKKITFDD